MEIIRSGILAEQTDAIGTGTVAGCVLGRAAELKRMATSGSNDRPVKRERSKVTANGMTYADWLTRAIESATDRRLTLAEIYDWMVLHVPGLSGQRYLHSSKGWKNAVRHTLSVNARFCKIARPGRPSFWALAPAKYTGPSSVIDAGYKKRTIRVSSSPTGLQIEDSAISPKRLKCMPSTSCADHESGSVVSTTSVTPPARTPQVFEVTRPETATSGDTDPSAPYYTLEYYQIPLALLAVAATANHIFSPKPSSNFRTSPTSAFVSFRPQETKG